MELRGNEVNCDTAREELTIMVFYNISKASTLTQQELDRLKVMGVGMAVNAKLAECGREASEVSACVLMAIERGKVKGCKWILSGNLGEVAVPTLRLGGERGTTVYLDLKDLTVFQFPGGEDPREGVNRSDWVPAAAVASRIQTRDKRTLVDKKEIEEHEYMQGGAFSIRITVLPIKKGKVAIWAGAAPGNPTTITEQAEKRNLTAHSAIIPTLGIQLEGGKGNNPLQAKMSPAEGEIISSNWGLYPMLMVRE